jgi:hypothetical protein
MRRLLSPLPALAASLLAVWLVQISLDYHVVFALGLLGATIVLVGLAYTIGHSMLRDSPYAGLLLMESFQILFILLAGTAGAILLWLAITKAPPDNAGPRIKQFFAAIAASLTAYLGAIIIKPDRPANPIRTAIKRQFANDFQRRRDLVEKDADDAVRLDDYGGQGQANEHVRGWDWDARRLRSRHLQRAVDAGYI